MPAHFMTHAWPIGKVILGLAAFIIVSGWLSMLAVSLLRTRQMLAKTKDQAPPGGDAVEAQPTASWRVQEPVVETATLDNIHYTPV